MSDFDTLNFLMLNDADRSAKGEQRLNELRDRAQSITKKTGFEPDNFYEFCKNNPVKEPKTIKNIITGAVAGTFLGAAILAATAKIMRSSITSFASAGALAGLTTRGMLGAFVETKSTNRAKSINDYEKYLEKLENNPTSKPDTETHNINYQEKYGDKILADRHEQSTHAGHYK